MRCLQVVIVAAILLVSAVASAQQTAVVNANAPIYVGPEVSQTPLRVAATGTILRVLQLQGDWSQVEFNDPQWGLRVGWVRRSVLTIRDEGLRPMDLSVREKATVPAQNVKEVGASTADAPQRQPTLTETAKQEAATLAPQAEKRDSPRGSMPGAYKWTGLGLVAAGGLTILTGFTGAENACYEEVGYDEDYCGSFKAGWIGAGVAMAAAGGIVWAVGATKRHPVMLSLGPNGIRGRYSF